MSLAREIKKKRPFDCPEQEAALNLRRTAGIVLEQHDRLFKRHGISSPLYNILRILRGNDGGLPCSEIGSQMVTRVPDTTRLIDRLERLGFVLRERGESDRRVVTVKITSAGLELLASLERPVMDLHKQSLGHLSESELADLNRLLTKARSASDDAAS
ncbi:MarR family winged helix-turn-helix transcriptional regulator [Stratiformator vulcanicus]|uniref:Transcriptional repressor MprA n=1 Tax=Stratiformator vulcanicus TaxID=2527980 RepID=A0A517QXF4_9PLAN|nr:MarR family transcriptional regulator [Stratiformator vulcanicus]QDT36294.1 Transcriptional repressor MprA [Stratiformator vulcanicus]